MVTHPDIYVFTSAYLALPFTAPKYTMCHYLHLNLIKAIHLSKELGYMEVKPQQIVLKSSTACMEVTHLFC